MQQANLPAPITRAARDVFAGVDLGTPMTGYDRPWATAQIKTPAVKNDYVWALDKIKTMIAFFFSGGTALKLIGQTGTGKTEFVTQFHAALNLPLFFIGANPKMEAYHLLGREVPSPSGNEWRDGPMLIAARYGLSILIDEYNVLDAGESTGLNAFLEGRPYTIPDTGETVVPAPGFRVFVTVNPKSFGYSGRNTQDLANDDRFIDLVFEYPEPEIEAAMVVDMLKHSMRQPDDVAKNIASTVVSCANKIRESFMGVSDSDDALPFTMSRRGVMEWARWVVLSKSLVTAKHSPLHHAADLVLGNRQDREGRLALHQIIELHTGQKEVTA